MTKSDSGCRGPWLGRYIIHLLLYNRGPPHLSAHNSTRFVFQCEQGFPWYLGPGFLIKLGASCALGLQCEPSLNCGQGLSFQDPSCSCMPWPLTMWISQHSGYIMWRLALPRKKGQGPGGRDCLFVTDHRSERRVKISW